MGLTSFAGIPGWRQSEILSAVTPSDYGVTQQLNPADVISNVTAEPSTEICICRSFSLSEDKINRNLDMPLCRRSHG